MTNMVPNPFYRDTDPDVEWGDGSRRSLPVVARRLGVAEVWVGDGNKETRRYPGLFMRFSDEDLRSFRCEFAPRGKPAARHLRGCIAVLRSVLGAYHRYEDWPRCNNLRNRHERAAA